MNTLIQKSFYILLSIISLTIISCDYITPPYSESATSIITKRKILIEDFTGHTCPNCPIAAKEADTIANDIFKGQVVVMALHVSTTFAAPHPGLFNYDFRTTEGTEIDNFFQISSVGLPAGMVNRIGYPTLNQRKSYTEWRSDVALELSKPPQAEITITNTYDPVNRISTTSIKSKFIEDLSGKYLLSVFYVEDSIIQAQVLPSGFGIDSNYIFMHTLRGSFNGTWGEIIGLDPAKDFEITKQYSTVLKTDAVPKNCRVVGIIYNDDTKEVVQADEKQIQ